MYAMRPTTENGQQVPHENISDVQIHRLLGFAFVVACLFPWVGPIKLGIDTQPYALILGAALCVVFALKRPIPAVLAWYAIPIVLSICYLMLADFSFVAIRSAGGYISPAALAVAAHFFYTLNT